MQDAQLADARGLAVEANVDGGAAAREEGGVLDLLQVVAAHPARVLFHLEIYALARETLLVRDKSGTQHQEDAVQETVDDLEPAGLAVVGRRPAPVVVRLPLLGLVL